MRSEGEWLGLAIIRENQVCMVSKPRINSVGRMCVCVFHALLKRLIRDYLTSAPIGDGMYLSVFYEI